MKRFFLASIVFSVVFSSCERSVEQETRVKEDSITREDNTEVGPDHAPIEGDTAQLVEKNGLSFYPVNTIPEFMDAHLTQSAPEAEAQLKPGKTTFDFEVTNYKLMEQTEGCNHCANSEKGQHIHFILNNSPYDALYEPKHVEQLEEGNYVELAFLSRSYHISLKHPDAYVLRQFSVGKPDTTEKVNLNAPHMFYSRPKGTYSGKSADKIVLDFFLVNTDLTSDGSKVQVTVDDNTTFMVNNWKPYIIEGLDNGEHSIKLELLNEQGELVESPFNPVTRTITVENKEEVEEAQAQGDTTETTEEAGA